MAATAGLACAFACGTSGTQDAVANGDTRTLSIYHTHSKESATVTFKRDGRYDRAALEQLNWLLRDWRVDEPTKMDPRLFDTVWEAYRQVGASEPIHVVSAYRSPGTNAMLRRRSRAVAEFSQHMQGKAMDFYLPDVSVDRIRAVAVQMQRGGVGWYPSAGSPFVHLDVGSVRTWPRMTHDQLARLFPDGKTVHLPSDNRPLARYEEARAEILSRGGSVAGVASQMAGGDEEEGPSIRSFFAGLFGGGSSAPAPAPVARGRQKPTIAVASADPEDPVGTRAALAYAAPAADGALRASLMRREGKAADAKSLLTAETAPEAAESAVSAPLPPRRPSELAAVVAALTMPLPPPRPVQLAALGGGMANLALPSETRGLVPPVAAAPVAKPVALVQAYADPKAQLRALFEAASAGGVSVPVSRAVPVHVAQARPRPEGAPVAVNAAPAGVTLRFSARSPGDDLDAARFSGSATRPVPGQR